MDIAELKGAVLERYQNLTDDEMMLVESMQDTELGQAILTMFKPVVEAMFSEPEDETERMLADDQQPFGRRVPPDEDIPDLARAMPEEFRERAPTMAAEDELPPMRTRNPSRLEEDTMPQALGGAEGRSQAGNAIPPMRARNPLEDRKGEAIRYDNIPERGKRKLARR
tara:strand:+ start:321 stop:824 length:504 start_codon:yes stop_codon:yes gene_type:complete